MWKGAGDALGNTEPFSDDTRWNGRESRRGLFLTGPQGYLWVAALFRCLKMGQFLAVILALSLLLRPGQCGLALQAIRTPCSCSSVASPQTPSSTPPHSLPLPSSLETPFLGFGTAVPPSRWFPVPTTPFGIPLSLPIIFVRVQQRAQSPRGISNHEDREAASLTSLGLDITCKSGLWVDTLGWDSECLWVPRACRQVSMVPAGRSGC